ncbi:MAG TPA: hypothetical protein VMM17_12760 [Gemmatimonadaceae bacterium]|nr:hypothetical protein [Gemmatimonadaceae bacterium]
MTATAIPDPATEIRITTLHATRGLNYWSKRPIIRMDLAVGAYEQLSSADVPGVTEALAAAMPGLQEHRCSIGTRGGFVTRLRRGTYAPHIIEHVALELQTMIGHEVGYGRTRRGDEPDEYTLVFEHRHEHVGLRAAALALEVVQRAFAGTLESVDAAVQELAALAETRDTPPLHQRVFCGITGGAARAEAQTELSRRVTELRDEPLVIDVSPAYLLRAGLPYSRSELAIILDTELTDVPVRYRDPQRAQRLVLTLADAVQRGGLVVCPAREWEVQDYAREEDCRVAIFSTGDDITGRDQRVASALGFVRSGRILLQYDAAPEDAGGLDPGIPPAAQVSAALAAHVLRGDGATAS